MDMNFEPYRLKRIKTEKRLKIMVILRDPYINPVARYALYLIEKSKLEKQLKAAVKKGDLEKAQLILNRLENMKFSWLNSV